jgi:hypothetical protein
MFGMIMIESVLLRVFKLIKRECECWKSWTEAEAHARDMHTRTATVQLQKS